MQAATDCKAAGVADAALRAELAAAQAQLKAAADREASGGNADAALRVELSAAEARLQTAAGREAELQAKVGHSIISGFSWMHSPTRGIARH